MTATMKIDELIGWLKTEGFNSQSTLDKLRGFIWREKELPYEELGVEQEEYDGIAFCEMTEEELKSFDPTLKAGPFKKLRRCWKMLQPSTREIEPIPKPPESPPAPRPESTSVVAAPTDQSEKGQSGKNSQEYKAVKNNLSDITRAIRMTPSAIEDVQQKFVEQDWLDPSRKPNEKELVELALSRIMGEVSEFWVFVAILRDITGLDLIADKLKRAVQSQSRLPPSAGAVESVTKQQRMTHPVHDFRQFGKPDLSSLMDLVGVAVKNKWRPIGNGLKVKVTDLDSFQMEEGSKPDATQHCMRRVFQTWHSAMTSEYSWQNLVRVLESPQVNEKAAVQELYESLCKK